MASKQRTSLTNLLIVAWSNSGGGAASATSRIFGALLRHGEENGLHVSLWTMTGIQADTQRHLLGHPRKSRPHAFFERLLWLVRRGPGHILLGRPSYLATTADIPTGAGKAIRNLKPDIVNLHWLGNRTISIQEIGRLTVPTVWTLSDEWLMSSNSLHFSLEDSSRDRRILVNSWVNLLKRVYLRRLFVIVKSERLAEVVRSSPLACRAYLAILPNPIDLNFWAVGRRRQFRCESTIHLCFGFSGRQAGFRKGADFVGHLMTALVAGEGAKPRPGIKLWLFGDATPETVPYIPSKIEVSVLGKIDEYELRKLYWNIDFLLVPSRVDNTPNIVIEGMATGAIVLAREGSGADELLDHGSNGIVWAANESVNELARRLMGLDVVEAEKLQARAALKIRESCSETAYASKFARLIEGVKRPEIAEVQGWEKACA